jgi:hypothetical protein
VFVVKFHNPKKRKEKKKNLKVSRKKKPVHFSRVTWEERKFQPCIHAPKKLRKNLYCTESLANGPPRSTRSPTKQ